MGSRLSLPRRCGRVIVSAVLGLATTALFCVAILFLNGPVLSAMWGTGIGNIRVGTNSLKYPRAMVVYARDDFGITELIAWPLWWQEQSLPEVIPPDIRVKYYRWGDGITKWSPPRWSKLSERLDAQKYEDLTLIDNEFAIGTPLPAIHTGATTLDGQNWESLPWRPVWPGLLLDGVLYGFAWYVLLFARRWPHRLLRKLRNQCVECGYDLRGADHKLCPECGASTSKPS